MPSNLIVALDFNSEYEALHLVEKLDPKNCALKVGSELFTLFGPQFVRKLIDKQFNLFLDLKFHDIPTTVAHACTAAADLGVWMMTVHAAGGRQMMQAASASVASYGTKRPILIAVTVLTSFSERELSLIGLHTPVIEHVKKLAILAKDSGIDGVVSSAHEVQAIKNLCGSELITVTPGIRLATDAKNDQSRVMTPKEAIAQGSDYLVVGRSITQSINPELMVAEILQNMHSA